MFSNSLLNCVKDKVMVMDIYYDAIIAMLSKKGNVHYRGHKWCEWSYWSIFVSVNVC